MSNKKKSEKAKQNASRGQEVVQNQLQLQKVLPTLSSAPIQLLLTLLRKLYVIGDMSIG